jgi:hypothetical protein
VITVASVDTFSLPDIASLVLKDNKIISSSDSNLDSDSDSDSDSNHLNPEPLSTRNTKTHRRRRASTPSEIDEMRFTSPDLARPALTPLGHRLLHLSEQKLDSLDTPMGGREAGTSLWKGVLVREAVRSAWKSVDEGARVDEMTNWHAPNAMALDVIGEEEEEEEDEEDEGEAEQRGAAWFEELLANMGEDEYSYGDDDEREAEWTESSVSQAVFDDLEYDADGMIAYTLPLPLSPPSPPVLVESDSSLSSIIVTPDSSTSQLELPSVEATVEVAVVAVDDLDDLDDVDVHNVLDLEEDELHVHAYHPPKLIRNRRWPTTPILLGLPTLSPSSSTPTSPESSYGLDSIASLPSLADFDWSDEDDDDLDFALPPPMHRSLSSDSTGSSCDDECECMTPPPVGCEDLEEFVAADVREGKRAWQGGGALRLELEGLSLI